MNNIDSGNEEQRHEQGTQVESGRIPSSTTLEVGMPDRAPANLETGARIAFGTKDLHLSQRATGERTKLQLEAVSDFRLPSLKVLRK